MPVLQVNNLIYKELEELFQAGVKVLLQSLHKVPLNLVTWLWLPSEESLLAIYIIIIITISHNKEPALNEESVLTNSGGESRSDGH